MDFLLVMHTTPCIALQLHHMPTMRQPSSGFGKTYKDVAGRPFQSLTRDPDVILKLLDRAAAARESDFLEGKIQQKGIFVLHNYMDPVEVSIFCLPQPLTCINRGVANRYFCAARVHGPSKGQGAAKGHFELHSYTDLVEQCCLLTSLSKFARVACNACFSHM
eukprot:1159524-Pelagomonas_calceolata.AAC.1